MAYQNRNLFLPVLTAGSSRSSCHYSCVSVRAIFKLKSAGFLLSPHFVCRNTSVLLSLFYKDTNLTHKRFCYCLSLTCPPQADMFALFGEVKPYRQEETWGYSGRASSCSYPISKTILLHTRRFHLHGWSHSCWDTRRPNEPFLPCFFYLVTMLTKAI